MIQFLHGAKNQTIIEKEKDLSRSWESDGRDEFETHGNEFEYFGSEIDDQLRISVETMDNGNKDQNSRDHIVEEESDGKDDECNKKENFNDEEIQENHTDNLDSENEENIHNIVSINKIKQNFSLKPHLLRRPLSNSIYVQDVLQRKVV